MSKDSTITLGRDCSGCKYYSELSRDQIECKAKNKSYYYGQRIVCEEKEKGMKLNNGLEISLNNEIENIEIKYFDESLPKLEQIDKGNWIDLRASEEIKLKSFEFRLIPLGVAMKLPKGYEAHIAPRSSTFKNFGIIQTNSVGVVDSTYCGGEDMWMIPVLATRDTVIHKGYRICQFRIIRSQPYIKFIESDLSSNESRGGFGSTGVQ